MTAPNGNGGSEGALARAISPLLMRTVVALLTAWGVWVTTLLVTAAGEATSAHRRIDGVAVVVSRLCGPLPKPGEEQSP